MARQYDKSPRQRFEWFGGRTNYNQVTSPTDQAFSTQTRILTAAPRATITAGQINDVAFPAGIVRGETCSIARFIGTLTLYDIDRRQQNISFEVGCGLVKTQVEDDLIADPIGSVQPVAAPDALEDLRASWLWHEQSVWDPQSAGANYTVFQMGTKVDSTNSRIFESNDVMVLSTQIRTLQNGTTAAVQVTARMIFQWRCLLRLD